MDVLKRIAALNHQKAQYSTKKLENLADDQESKLDKKKSLRKIQEQFDDMKADGKVGEKEMSMLFRMMRDDGVIPKDAGWGDFMKAVDDSLLYVDTSIELDTGNNEKDGKIEKNLDALGKKIENAIKDTEDSEALVQFRVQLATSEMTAAESQRSGAEKRLEEHRNQLLQKWTA